MKALETENRRLKNIVADQMLGMEILQEAIEKNCEPGHKRQVGSGFVSRGRCSGRQVCRYFKLHGAPQYIRSDNGSEFIEKSLQECLRQAEIKTHYIDPSSPWQSGYIESFHSRFRKECLDREQLWTLSEVRVVMEDWRVEYNHIRPHKSLELETPKAFAAAAQGGPSGRATPSLRPHLDNPSIVERCATHHLVLGLT